MNGYHDEMKIRLKVLIGYWLPSPVPPDNGKYKNFDETYVQEQTDQFCPRVLEKRCIIITYSQNSFIARQVIYPDDSDFAKIVDSLSYTTHKNNYHLNKRLT